MIDWIIFACFVVVLTVINILIVRYYNNKGTSETFPTVVAVLAQTITLLSVLLIPVDIYTTSSNQSESVKEVVRVFYLVIYCCVLSFAFCIVPFACFYYEAYDPEANSPFLKRIWDGLKYTFGLILIVVILLVVGIFVRSPSSFTGSDPPSVWANKILAEGKDISTITFTFACLTMIGYIVWITYTVYGLAALPIGLIRGRKSMTEDERDIRQKIDSKRSQRKNQKEEDRAGLLSDKLADGERALQKRAKRLQDLGDNCSALYSFSRPFFVVFGVLFLILSFLLVISLGLTTLDRTLHHIDCSYCGFILSHKEILNPLDEVLIFLSKFFPVDYIMLSAIVLYFYFSTLSAITEIGIRFFCLPMYKFRKGRTEPQALMCTSILLMLSILALNNSIITFAPTYATYGAQTVMVNGTYTSESCSIDSNVTSSCTMTQLGFIVHSVELNVGFFGLFFYGCTWIFVAGFLISLLIAALKPKKSNVESYSDDDEEDEE